MRIANVDGSVAESLDYTAFDDRRAYGNPSGAGAASTLTPRGFTGHEMVDGAQVIHMNGRIYDPQLGRFLQPDPVIQEPTNAQSWNAYTYVFNNPLAHTDPTGMMSERAWNNVWRVAALVISIVSMNATNWYMGVSTQAGITAAAAGGFFAGYAATGTLKSAVIGAFSAAITAGIACSSMNGYEQMAAQAVTGGVVESLQGGSFGHGFAAAGLTAAFMPQVGGIRNDVIRTAVGALIGGTISAVTGGKFANGAISGAVQGAMMDAPTVEEPTNRPRNRDINRKMAEALRRRVNDAMDDSGVSRTGYSTVDDAADAWWSVVGPMALSHEVGAGIYLGTNGRYYVGRAYTSGSRAIIWNAWRAVENDAFIAFVHNHPGGGAIRLSGDGNSYTLHAGIERPTRVCVGANCSGDVRFAMQNNLSVYAFNTQGRQVFNYNVYMILLKASPGAPVPVTHAITTTPNPP